jgi:1-acyl-sn-glycerol-3-phosphate acyltransferase
MMSERQEQQRAPRRLLHRLVSGPWRWLGALLVAVGGRIARRLFRLRVEGDEHLPATGPAIIAANHLSFFDHVALVLRS